MKFMIFVSLSTIFVVNLISNICAAACISDNINYLPPSQPGFIAEKPTNAGGPIAQLIYGPPGFIPLPQFISPPIPSFGSIPLPQFISPPIPSFGSIPLPQFNNGPQCISNQRPTLIPIQPCKHDSTATTTLRPSIASTTRRPTTTTMLAKIPSTTTTKLNTLPPTTTTLPPTTTTLPPPTTTDLTTISATPLTTTRPEVTPSASLLAFAKTQGLTLDYLESISPDALEALQAAYDARELGGQ